MDEFIENAPIYQEQRPGVLRKQKRQKQKRQRKLHQKSELDRRLPSIGTKLDENNAKAVDDRKIAGLTVDNYVALRLKLQWETCTVPDPTDIVCFTTSEFFVHKALMSFPNGSSAALEVWMASCPKF